MGDGGSALDNPILNSPYEPPAVHFEIGRQGPTGQVLPGRRRSESFIPVPPTRKGRLDQQRLGFEATGERREENTLINDIRGHVELWRARGYPGVTPISRKLLQHWADPGREDRMLFCQREARKRRSSWPRWRAGTAPRTTGPAWTSRTASTTPGCPGSD